MGVLISVRDSLFTIRLITKQNDYADYTAWGRPTFRD